MSASVRRVKRRIGRERRAGDERAEQRGERDAGGAEHR